MRRLIVGGLLALLLLAGGCRDSTVSDADAQAIAAPEAASETAAGSDPPDAARHDMSEMSHEPMEMAEEDHGDLASFGEPGDPASADREVLVEALEEGGFHYEPAAIQVDVDDTVTFRVHNGGEAVHEFVLGDEHAQEAHEAEMRAMASEDGMMMHDEPDAISLQPGETKSVTWRFSEPGELMYGCHEPGHYEAGMRGDLTVKGG